MTLIESLLALAVLLFMIGFGYGFWQEKAEEATLRAEFGQVRGAALEFARARCASPPSAPERLPDVLAAVGDTGDGIRAPTDWSVRLIGRPGGAGVITRILHRTPADTLASRYFLRRPGAVRDVTDTFVEVPVQRDSRSANREGFRFLMSDQAC